MSEETIFFKKHKTGNFECYYYIVKKNNNYVVCVEAIHHEQVTPTWTVVRGEGKECLKLQNEQEAEEIITLLRKGRFQQFEENYGDRDWVVEW